MIIAKTPEGLRLTTQPDHAFFSAELLSLWRRDDFPENPRRDEVVFAVREHDNGWREADAAPRITEDGEPMTFYGAPMELRSDIWFRGIHRFAEEHPWASLLILEHAYQLHEGQRNKPGWADFYEGLEVSKTELLEASAEPLDLSVEDCLPALAVDYRLLELTDLLSLAVCSGWTEEIEREGYRFRFEGKQLRLDPFPLAGATRFRIRCRTIPQRAYQDAVDLAVTLASARWQDWEIRVESF